MILITNLLENMKNDKIDSRMDFSVKTQKKIEDKSNHTKKLRQNKSSTAQVKPNRTVYVLPFHRFIIVSTSLN